MKCTRFLELNSSEKTVARKGPERYFFFTNNIMETLHNGRSREIDWKRFHFWMKSVNDSETLRRPNPSDRLIKQRDTSWRTFCQIRQLRHRRTLGSFSIAPPLLWFMWTHPADKYVATQNPTAIGPNRRTNEWNHRRQSHEQPGTRNSIPSPRKCYEFESIFFMFLYTPVMSFKSKSLEIKQNETRTIGRSWNWLNGMILFCHFVRTEADFCFSCVSFSRGLGSVSRRTVEKQIGAAD